ncbi:tripartite tricarboxylate transporter permease [Rhodoligotrophos defluvii]|uniref:tripartite tricarboxylate transporter permease n=1 Tax=Rhodoligotrophos defluvii TaxID=2561934 RepID=UPI0010C9F344|nr:tripartite tricarboxylate transporter permease [Rhodoligotrophos defluvii]
MDLFANLALGASVAFTINNLGYSLLGCLIGTVIGVLPGLGPVSTIAMLIPLTFYLEPVSGLIMLAGIYYGAQYGGSTTAILLNLPGEASNVVTCLDGHQMARKGRAGPALVIAALGSFFAGSLATLLIALLATPLALAGMSFGSPEYFSLMVLGLLGAVVLAQGSVLKATAMVTLGVLLGLVGMDVDSAVWRFTFGFNQLADGINIVPVAVGLFGVADVIRELRHRSGSSGTLMKVGTWMPSRTEIRQAIPATLRGTTIGSALGILPGGGAVLSSFTAYIAEKKLSRDPSRFGQGAVEGVAGPESANNAAAQTSFIPMLSLGIPSNVLMAMMMGAMIIHGIQPGPQVMTEKPDLFWGLIVSMWIGNAMLVILNLPLVGIWIQLLRTPYRIIYIAILLFAVIGVYTVNNSYLDVMIAALFGLFGVFLLRYGFEPAPLLLGFVLGRLLETNFRRSMVQSGGDLTVFIDRPISLALLLIALGFILLLLLPSFRAKREEAFCE